MFIIMYAHIWINQVVKERRIGVHSKNVITTARTLHIAMKLANSPTEKTLPH